MPRSLLSLVFGNLNGMHQPNDMFEQSILGVSVPRELSDETPDTVDLI